MLRPSRCRIFLALATLLVASPSAAEWPRFRGPNGSGVVEAAGLPLTFGPDENLEWSTPVPFGRSSPVLGGELIYLTAIEDDALTTLAVDRASGEIRWRRALARARQDEMYHATDSSTPTPATDGRNVYVFFQELGLVSYDATGEERWRHPLGPFENFYGIASSPVLAGDALLLLCDQSSGSFLLALDRDSGAVRWRAERPGRMLSYTTPVLYPSGASPRQAIVYGSKWVDAYDLASGELAWSLSGVGAVPVASPTLAGDHLYITSPDQEEGEPPPPFSQLAAEHDADADGVLTQAEFEGTWMADHFGWLDTDGDGQVSRQDWEAIVESGHAEGWGLFGIRLPGQGHPQPEVVWNYRRNVAYLPTPVVANGVVFTVLRDIVTSLDPLTGAVHKRGRLGGPAQVNASPIAADGKVFFATGEGTVVVIDAVADWEVLAVNELGADIYATPAIADGHIYVRTRERLMSFAASEVGPAAAD